MSLSIFMAAESAPAHNRIKLWRPRRVLITPAARELVHGRDIAEKAASLGAEVVELNSNRLIRLASDDSSTSIYRCEVHTRSRHLARLEAKTSADSA